MRSLAMCDLVSHDRHRHEQVPRRRAPGLLGRPHPLDNSSGKRQGKAKAKKGNRYLGGLLGETAVAAGKTQTREGARSRRIARRRGKTKARVAVGSTQMRVYHRLLSHPGTRYTDLGPDYYERQASTRRQIARHVGRLGALGFEVTLCRIPEPGPGGPASTQAA
jgi:hypothetical protein